MGLLVLILVTTTGNSGLAVWNVLEDVSVHEDMLNMEDTCVFVQINVRVKVVMKSDCLFISLLNFCRFFFLVLNVITLLHYELS